MREAHNLIGELLSLIGLLFVDLGRSHNPMGILLHIRFFFIKESPTLLDSYCVILVETHLAYISELLFEALG